MMFTPSKATGINSIDLTILNTPQPQATSTVQRKNTLENKYLGKDLKDHRYKRSLSGASNATRDTEESSLGILDNISSFLAEVSEIEDKQKVEKTKVDAERELARKLLQKCSDFKISSLILDTNKENDANVQNLSNNTTPPTLTEPSQSTLIDQSTTQQQTPLQGVKKTSNLSVVFEPNEISARSSALSRASRKLQSVASNENPGGISFDASATELMAQFNNEEFRSASQMASQMLADEIAWQQNCSYAVPVATSTEKEYLDLSCFSGIIGELDLSVESCAGRKVSIGEFFKRKCGKLGELSDDAIERPSFGMCVKSPQRTSNLVPLVDTTMTTEASVASVASTPKERVPQVLNNITNDMEEPSIMSLSSIAQALQDIDNGTPRRLVDQLIMAKKKRKCPQKTDEKMEGNTYTLLSSDRKSLPATPSAAIEKREGNIGLLNLSTKLSLDSKVISDAEMKQRLPRVLSYGSDTAVQTEEFPVNISEHVLKKESSNKNATSSYNQSIDFKSFVQDPKLSLSYCNTDKNLLEPRRASKIDASVSQEIKRDVKNLSVDKNVGIKKENVSYKDSTVVTENSYSQILSQSDNVIIGRKSEELCSCIVGISRETDIELLNKSDRWIICSLRLNQLQGDKQCIILKLPQDIILIKPNAVQSTKIGVKIVKMTKPIIAVLNLTASDMVTRSEWIMKHIICFKPEELHLNISTHSTKQELDFKCVAENYTTSLPVTVENRNSVPVSIKLSLLQNDRRMFSIDRSPSEPVRLNESSELKYFVLKPQEPQTVNVQFKAVPVGSQVPSQKQLHQHEAKLILQVKTDESNEQKVKEVPLVARIGISKIQVVDTDIPISIPRKQSKSLNIINCGTVPATVSASIVQDDESLNAIKDFSVKPESLFLQCDEVGSFVINYKPQNTDVCERHVKIKLITGSNIYHYSIIGEQSNAVISEAENENYLRCETPQCPASVGSPSSPRSIAFNRSGISGRNSPSSTVSGSTVAGDKVPIKATHAALVWNSVKAGKSETKEFTIRNTSNNKIKIQAVISDNDKSFRFLRERQAVGTSMVLALQRTESRTLSVMYSPHHTGAAAGKIIFSHYEPKKEDNELRPTKVIFLYGYGGYGKVEISEAFKDTSGKMWLSLGVLNSGGSLNAKIRFQNTGDLYSYANIKLTPKAVYPAMVSSWHVNPTELLLNPKEIQWVTLEFRPRKEDLALLQRSDVAHVGTITVTHGDEPTRWRIRRLYNKMKETGELSGNENEAFRNIVYPLCRAFPGEQLIPDLNLIRDSVQNLGDLCRGVGQHEIMLTMEMRADETLSILHDNADDSQMFYSLCSDNSHVYEAGGESFLPSETMPTTDHAFYQDYEDHFTVNPTLVILTPPSKTEAIVTVLSSCRVAQPFETTISNPEYLSVVPAEGMIPTGRGFPLKIRCKQRLERNVEAILEIYTENNKQDVLIRVIAKRQ